MNPADGKTKTSSSRAGEYFRKNALRAWGFVAAVFPVPENTRDVTTRTIVGLVKAFMLADDGKLQPEEITAFQEVFSQYYSEEQVKVLTEILRDCDPVEPVKAVDVLQKTPRKRVLSVVKMLEELFCGSNSQTQAEMFSDLCSRLEVTPEEFQLLKEEAAKNTRSRILKSGAGVLIALFIIGLFIATATVLRSVVFGLILAYIFLPLEKLYEKLIAGKYNPVHWFFAGFDLLFAPLKNLAAKLAGRNTEEDEYAEKEKQKQIISRASALTVLSMLAIFAAIFLLLSHYSLNYVNKLSLHISSAHQTEVDTIATEEPAAPETANDSTPNWEEARRAEGTQTQQQDNSDSFLENIIITPLENQVNNLKERFESIPAVNWALEQIADYLSAGNATETLKNFVASQSSGIFSFTAGFISNIGSIAVDILLTIFFFVLFIIKIANATNRKQASRDENYSRYIVRTVFNGKWLPLAGEAALHDGEMIIEQVIYKLKVWLKGYLVLMCIDFTVYTTAFYFLGVPYFPLLGIVAACGVLLPYIGPIIAALFTLLVTLALGGDSVSGMQILGIAGIYLWQNGIVDQFFLYPWIIGDSLGLTAMETIVVVLLGGIFAGITGMIFALPAAAIIKYLIPQIYKLWK